MTLRTLVKRFAFAAVTLGVLPALVSYRIRAALLGRDRALEGSSQVLGLVPGVLGQYVRRAFLCRVLEHCDRTVTVEFGVLFSHAGARLDEHVYVGPRCHLGLVHLEREVLVGAGVHIPSGGDTHGTDDLTKPIREQRSTRRLVSVGEGSW